MMEAASNLWNIGGQYEMKEIEFTQLMISYLKETNEYHDITMPLGDYDNRIRKTQIAQI